MMRFKWLSAAALLAVAGLVGSATPARADLILTLKVSTDSGANSILNTFDITTNTLGVATVVGSASGTFSEQGAGPGAVQLNFTGTVNGVTFTSSVAATTNTPGTSALASFTVGSNTIATSGTGHQISIFGSASGYTAPFPNVIYSSATSGTLTTGTLSNFTFDSTADTVTGQHISIPGPLSGTSSLSSTPAPMNATLSNSPYTMTATLAATLGANSTTSGAQGSVTLTAPEPASLLTALSGLPVLGLVAFRRYRRKQA